MYLYKIGHHFGDYYLYIFWTGFSIQTRINRFHLHILGIPILQTGKNMYDVCIKRDVHLRLFNYIIF